MRVDVTHSLTMQTLRSAEADGTVAPMSSPTDSPLLPAAGR